MDRVTGAAAAVVNVLVNVHVNDIAANSFPVGGYEFVRSAVRVLAFDASGSRDRRDGQRIHPLDVSGFRIHRRLRMSLMKFWKR
jgi:hypothetical protein